MRCAGTLDTKPSPGLSASSGVIASIEGLTKGLAVDLAPAGVRVNLVAPGTVRPLIFLSVVTTSLTLEILRRLTLRFGFMSSGVLSKRSLLFEIDLGTISQAK